MSQFLVVVERRRKFSVELLQFLVFLGVQLCAKTSLLPATHEAVMKYPHCFIVVYCVGRVWEGEGELLMHIFTYTYECVCRGVSC